MQLIFNQLQRIANNVNIDFLKELESFENFLDQFNDDNQICVKKNKYKAAPIIWNK